MSEQHGTVAKLSKSQKKKKSALKKKVAKRNAKLEEEKASTAIVEQKSDEVDARIVEQFHEQAMWTRDFQMLNIRGKLLVHPSRSFLEAFTSLRQAMGRDTYPNRINHAQRLYHFGALSAWSVVMGAASNPDRSKDHEHSGQDMATGELGSQQRMHAFTDQSCGVLGLMIWYPIFSTCMAAGDKLACIALRDVCVLLRTCYGLFRNDTTRLEQFVFDARNPGSIKQLDWVARRVEVPPSPPQTPPQGFAAKTKATDSEPFRDPFRSPIVVAKRWADYDDDDESLGSPMSLPITPESSRGYDIPTLDLDQPEDMPNASSIRADTLLRRPPSIVIAIPTLSTEAMWFSAAKTVLPVPRISVYTFEDSPRTHHTTSSHPMKLQSSSLKYIAGPSGNVRVRARLEHWVREDAQKNLKAKLSLGLSSAAKKMVDAQTESVVFNRMTALAGLNNGELLYMGEADILGAGVGVSIEDVREVVTGRFRPEKDKTDEVDLKALSGYPSKEDKTAKIMLVPIADGWICRHLSELQP